MTPGSKDEDPLASWISQLEEGTLSSEDHQTLMHRLRCDREARRTYLEHTRLTTLLQDVAKSRAELGGISVSPETLRREKRRSAIISLSYATAALIILGLTLYLLQIKKAPPSIDPRIVLDGSSDARFSIVHADPAPAPGNQLLPGDQITLERGLISLRFPSGVEALIEGPSQLELVSKTTLRMDAGLGWFRVPPAGQGFTVRTTTAQIIDLGTAFGVRFHDDDSVEVHVGEGRVKVKPSTSRAKDIDLVGGEAMRFTSRGKSETIHHQPEFFRTKFSKKVPHLHWSFDQLKEGTFPVDTTFPKQGEFSFHLKHHATPHPDSREALVPGRFGQALSLDGLGRYAESPYPGIAGNAPRTIAAWVRYHPGARTSDTASPEPRLGQGFKAPSGRQAYLLRYTNSGLVSSPGGTGTPLEAGTTYQLTFQTQTLEADHPSSRLVQLVSFDPATPAGERSEMRHSERTGKVLAELRDEVFPSENPVPGTLSYHVGPSDPSLGRELAIRIIKTPGLILYDDFRLVARRNDGSHQLVFAEDFEQPLVHGYAQQTLPEQGWIGPGAKDDLGFGSSQHGLWSDRPASSRPFLSWGLPGTQAHWASFAFPHGPPVWSVNDPYGHHDGPISPTLTPDRWHHLAMVYTGIEQGKEPEVILYLDGQPLPHRFTPSSSSGLPQDPDSRLLIGTLQGVHPDDPTLKAEIDELHIVRAPLAEPEIRTLMERNVVKFNPTEKK